MKKFLAILTLLLSANLFAQVKIGDNPQTIDQNSILELESSEKVLVVTRISGAEMNAITPLNGAVVYNTDVNCLFQYNNNSWTSLCIDVMSSETITALVDNNDGSISYVSEDGAITIISKSALIDNGDGTFTFDNGNGTPIILDVSALETVTTLLNNTDGTFTYTSEDGTITNVNTNSAETLTAIVLNANNASIDYSDEDGVITNLNLAAIIANLEALTTIVDNNDGTLTYTDEDGVTTTLDVANLETLTTIALNTDNASIDYTDEDGVVTNLNLATIIANLEALTTIVDNNDGTLTYTDEDGVATTLDVANLETLTTIALNTDNASIDYTDEDGVITNLNLAAIIANLEALTTIVDNNDGTLTYTDEDGIATTLDIANLETLTTIALNTDNASIDYTDEDGVVTNLNLAAIIANLEALTTIVDNNDGTLTYTDEDGVATTLDVANLETLTTIALNTDNASIDYTDEDGVVTNLNLTAIIANLEALTTIVDNNDGTLTYTDEDGIATTLDIANLETLTTIALNTDNASIDYTDEDGVVTNLNLTAIIANLEALTTIVDNNDGTLTYTDEDGVATTLDVANLETLTTIALNTDNASIDYTDEDGVITNLNLAAIIANLEALTTIVDNNDGTLTYTNEDGVTTTLDVANLETLTTIALNIDNASIDYTDEDGVVTNLNLAAIIANLEALTTIVDNNDGTLTYTDEDGVTTTLDIANLETLTSIALNTNNASIDYTDEDGVVTNLNLTAIIANLEALTTIVDNNDGTLTYTDEDGIATTLDIANLETLTTIALNTDNASIDYTDEDGVITNLNLAAIIANLEALTTIVDNNDGTLTYTDEDGVATTLDIANLETLTTIALNTDNASIDYTDEDGVVTNLNLTAIIANLEALTTIVDNNDGTLTYTDEDGNPTIIDASNLETLTTIINNGDLTYTYLNEDGTPVVISVIDNDNDSTNELQDLFLNGTELQLSTPGTAGNLVDLTDQITLPMFANGSNTNDEIYWNGTDWVYGTRVATVNLISPDADGNINIPIGNVYTGPTTSTGQIGPNEINGTPQEGDIYVVNSDAPDPAQVGNTYIYDADTMDWIAIDPFNAALYDPRYVNVTGDTMVGNLDMSSNTITSLGTPTGPSDATPKSYIDAIGLVDNGDGSFSLQKPDGTVDSVSKATLTANLDATYTFNNNDGNPITIDISQLETLTTIALNTDNTNINYTDENGIITQLDLTDIVENLETVTTLINNTDGTFTYTSEDGTETTYDETTTNIALNTDDTNIDYTDENGLVTQLNLTDLVDNLETVTSLTFNTTSNQLEYLDENGIANAIDLNSIVHTGTQGSVFFAGADGNPTEDNNQLFWDETNNRMGIGTNTPDNKLQVSGAIRSAGFLNSDGNAGEPAYRFTDDTNTGLYSPAADEIGLTVGGLEAVNIDETSGATTVTINETLDLDGPLLDENDAPGTSGQVLTATATGTEWADAAAETVTTITGNIATGNTIATYQNEDGDTEDINETITTFVQDDTTTTGDPTATGEITYTDEEGTEFKAQVVAAETDNQIEVGANGGAYLGPTVYTGTFIISTEGIVTITGIPFKPSQVTFVANANVESLNIDSDNGTANNDRSIKNSFGTMNGFARNTNGTLIQQVMYTGGHGASINDNSRYASSSNCIGIRYGDYNGSSLGKIEAAFGTFTPDGFTVSVNYTDGVITANNSNSLPSIRPDDIDDEALLVIFTAYK
ncbi:beta strand repeat-containing protein [Psychroserpens sp. NJDZ02]|uniref:beta strand repeat-containing protein n=1 Tax=Psychroserpens sp. NJDZ02 TaxID=2570561 RepID=UPI0010A94DB7|nr:hypothetical protein [Psychroserpens sp. NJDZ02]QCE41688.1 hypothetical protein E9099_09760 [Psychroserpens sp. NJDZ02]